MTARAARQKSRGLSGRARGGRDARLDAPEPSPSKPLGLADAWIVVGALVLLWLALFGPNLTGHVFVLGDAASYRAYAEFARERFSAFHDRTLWNPYVFLGIPSAASLADPRPQWAPDVVLAWWDALTSDPVTALRMLLFGLLVGGLTTAWLVRALWSAPPQAMVLAGSTVMAASGLVGPLAFGHDAQVWCIAITPALLLASCRLFSVPSAFLPGAIVLFALAFAMLVFAGHPQFLVYGLLLVLVLALERQATLARPRRLAAFAVAILLGMAMSAGSWLPAWNYGAISVRADAQAMAREAGSFSANALDLLALAWPRAAGYGGLSYHGGLRATDFPNHVGFVVLVLAVAGAFARPAARGGRAAHVLATFATLALLAALGTHLAVMDGLLRAVPVLRSFRTPVTWMIPASLVLGMLAARGLGALAARAPRRWATAIAWTLALVGVAEMSAVTVPILRRASGPASRLQPAPPDALAIAAARDSLHRSYSFTPNRFFSNDWISWRVRSVSGLHGAVMSNWNDLRVSGVLLRGGFMRAIATRWVFDLPSKLAGSTGLRETQGGYEIENTLLRAYAAHRVEVVPDRAAMLKAVGNPRFDATEVAFALDLGAAGDYPGSSLAAIEWRRDEPDRLSLKVSAPEPCFVVVADAWAPGWSARIDGRPVQLTLVDAALRGVPVPGGTHLLDMAYTPPGWKTGRLLAGLGWLAWLALGVWALVGGRWRR